MATGNYSVILSVENISDMELFYPRYTFSMKKYIVPYLALIGVLCNISFLIVVYKVKQFHTCINVLLVNLALADILFLVTEVTQSVLLVVKSPFQLDYAWAPVEWACNVSVGGVHLFEAASLLFIVTVSIDRYFAVCRPFQHRLSKRLRNIFFCGMPWVLSVILGIAFAFTVETSHWHWQWDSGNVTLPNKVLLCEAKHLSAAMFALLNLAPYFISVCLNGFLYFWILKTLRKTYAVNSRRSVEARMSAIRMLLFNWLVYLLCVSPNFLLLIVNNIFDIETGVDLETMCRTLLVVNSSINPLIYNAFNSRYRQAFTRVFSFHGIRAKPTRVSFSAPSSVRTTKV